MEGNVLGLAALDLILRRFRARLVRVTFDVEIMRVHANDRAADAPGLRIPADMIANLEVPQGRSAPYWALREARGVRLRVTQT